MVILFICSGQFIYAGNRVFNQFVSDFTKEYGRLNIPELTYDYRDYFLQIPALGNLKKQEDFFIGQQNLLQKIEREKLSFDEDLIYQHIEYEIKFNLKRIAHEIEWTNSGRAVPADGLHLLVNYKEWYALFIQKFTGLEMDPEDVMAFGKEEVLKVKREIDSIRIQLGYDSEIELYQQLQKDAFFLTDKTKIIEAFGKTNANIRMNLSKFIGKLKIDEIYPLEWTDAGPNTPPGIYLNRRENSYGKDVFLYNFYGSRYNVRCIDWIFMHEGIPGHHLQASWRNQTKPDSVQTIFTYPGNFEGWACYVEYEGKSLGVYNNIYSYLDKWEWDLIRSARVVMEVGIHYYGWTRMDALNYWKENITGQDDIAEREITRITNWPGQALSYKLGAATIMDLKNDMKKELGEKYKEVTFNRTYLSFGMRPLEIIKNNFKKKYKTM